MTRGIDDGALRDRVQRFLEQRLPEAARVGTSPARVEARAEGGVVTAAEAARGPFRAAGPGTAWGAPWTTTWFRIHGAAPHAEAGCRVELVVDLGFSDAMPGFQAEGMVYVDGAVVKALNPTTRWVPVAAGEAYDLLVEAAANPTMLPPRAGGRTFSPTALGDPRTAGSDPLYVLGEVAALVLDENVEELAVELRVLTELAWSLEESSSRRARILSAVDEALDSLDPANIRGTCSRARGVLAPALALPADPDAHRLTAVGHAHIDSAWLWPFRETRRKVARTVANVLELMDGHPDLVYAMSSAQQYAWLKEDHPALFDRLRERVREGRFVPVGGMWVESDVNMPSGESLVHQLLAGAAFFERELGVASTVGWLPDSFGYSGALPQLLRSAGLRGFVTQKMSWNTTNRFPHHTFWWEGIDGTRIATHFPSVDTYNATMTGDELAHAARNLSDPAVLDASILPFGHGDGGGGPTREMLQRARRTADLGGSPAVALARPERFFEALEETVASGRALPVWLGEMYLELHRGVLTSQARTKEAHRRVERLLHEAELWSTQAAVRTGLAYPHRELATAWQELLLMEFHDVLPGSSIAWVHREAVERLDAVAGRLDRIVETALAALGEADGAEMLANAAPVEASGVAALAIGAPPSEDVRPVESWESGGAIHLRNPRLEVVVERASGTIVSLVDRLADRELVAPGGRLNVLTLHRDAPSRWDAWDIDRSIDADVRRIDGVAGIEIERTGASATIRVRRVFGSSTATQWIELRSDEAQLRLGVTVDWREREHMLKAEFPLAVVADRWQAETQFGYLERPTHRNTSWDEARFEACAHRWVRVAETDYGVALANLRSYGHDALRIADDRGVVGTRVRASLLRGSRFPDPDADLGLHEFGFALLPAPDPADAVRAGHQLGLPPRAVRGRAVGPLASSSAHGVLVSAVKLAEDGSGDLIVRLYESRGAHARTRLAIGCPVGAMQETDILERPLPGSAADLADLADLAFAPFQVRTFRFAMRDVG